MSHLNIQQKVSKNLAQKSKDTKSNQPTLTEEESRRHEFEEVIKPSLTEENIDLLQRLLEKLANIGRYTEFDIYNLMKKYDFNTTIIQEVTSVMVEKAKEAESGDWKPITRGKSKAPEKDEKKNERDNERKKSKRRTQENHDENNEEDDQRGYQKSFRTNRGRNNDNYYQDDHYEGYNGRYNNNDYRYNNDRYNNDGYNNNYNRYNNNRRYNDYDNNYDNRNPRQNKRTQDRNKNNQQETNLPSLIPVYVAKTTSEEAHPLQETQVQTQEQHTTNQNHTTQNITHTHEPSHNTNTHQTTPIVTKSEENQTEEREDQQRATSTNKNDRNNSKNNNYQRGRQQRMFVPKKKETSETLESTQPSVQESTQSHHDNPQKHYTEHNIKEFFQKAGEKTKLDPRDQVDYIDSVIHPPKNRPDEKVRSSGITNEQDKTSQTASKPTIDKSSHQLNGHQQQVIGSHRNQNTTTIEQDHRQSNQNLQTPPGFLPYNTMGFPQSQIVPTKDLASMFTVPYIVFPQPNGTSIIQPLYIPPTTQLSGGFQQPSFPQTPFFMYPQGFQNQQEQNTSDIKHSHDNKNQVTNTGSYFNFNEGDKVKKNQNQQQTNTQQQQQPFMYPFVFPGTFPVGYMNGQQSNPQGKNEQTWN